MEASDQLCQKSGHASVVGQRSQQNGVAPMCKCPAQDYRPFVGVGQAIYGSIILPSNMSAIWWPETAAMLLSSDIFLAQ